MHLTNSDVFQAPDDCVIMIYTGSNKKKKE